LPDGKSWICNKQKPSACTAVESRISNFLSYHTARCSTVIFTHCLFIKCSEREAAQISVCGRVLGDSASGAALLSARALVNVYICCAALHQFHIGRVQERAQSGARIINWWPRAPI
jgi:hypothetical protein